MDRLQSLTGGLWYTSAPGNVRYSAYCIKPREGFDWSLATFYDRSAPERQPLLAAELAAIGESVASFHLYAPTVGAMSGMVVPPTTFDTRIWASDRVSLFRNREVPSDGTWLAQGESFVMSGGGCPVVVASAEEYCIVAHASRESLIDKQRLLGGASRRHESVIHAIADALRMHDVKLSQASLHVFFAIEPAAFDHNLQHPDIDHRRYNNLMVRHVFDRYRNAITIEADCGFLDCAMLAKLQAEQVGFAEVVIEGTLTESGLFAHTRHTNAEMRKRRNLVVIHRY